MDSTNIETNQPINITPMTAEEAQECVTAIKSNLESLGAMILDLERRRGWEALGYSSFRECAMAEFGKSQGYVYKLLHAASVDENLATDKIYPLDKSEIASIPTSHKEELHKLLPDQQAAALKQADAIAQAEGKPREARHIAQVVKEYKSVAAQTEAKGQALGLPTGSDSVLPQADLIDELTHTNPTDVDDRLGAPPTQPKLYKHGIAAGDTVRVLLGKGKHSDKITTASSVTAKEIVTPLGSFKPSALVKYIDHTAEMKALGIVPGAMIEASDGTKAEVICTFADGRVLASGRYYRYKELTVLEPKAEEGAIAVSVETILPEILSDRHQPGLTLTLTQWQATQKQLAEVQQAFKAATVEIEQLKAERDELDAECQTLQSKNGALHSEIAHLKDELTVLKQQVQATP